MENLVSCLVKEARDELIYNFNYIHLFNLVSGGSFLLAFEVLPAGLIIK